MQLFREAGKAVGAMPALLFQPVYVSTTLSADCIDKSDIVSLWCKRKKNLHFFLDVSAYRIHGGGVGLLHAVDRKRRRYLHEQEETHSFQEGRATCCECYSLLLFSRRFDKNVSPPLSLSLSNECD